MEIYFKAELMLIIKNVLMGREEEEDEVWTQNRDYTFN